MTNVIRIRNPHALRPLHVVLIAIVAVTVAGGALLLSAAESTTPVDGAIPWREGSLLRSVVQLLCLSYEFPTAYQGEIKMFLLGVGAGVAALAIGVALLARPATGEDESAGDLLAYESEEERAAAVEEERGQVAPLVAAQVLAGAYVLWSFCSAGWSRAPEWAIGGSGLLAIQILWSFCLGGGLSGSAAKTASRIIPVAMAVAGAVAIWYWFGRNPTLRAKFPFGNPTFLAACLIPALLLWCALLVEKVSAWLSSRRAADLWWVGGGLAALGLCAGAFYLTESRGALVGLAAGALVLVAAARAGRVRVVSFVLCGVVVVGAMGYVATSTSDVAGRAATIRFRDYTWGYALRLFSEKRILGHGQGGYVLMGDSYVPEDVLADPLVFTARIAHAHSEWLEVLADLGSIGFVLVAGALVLTVQAALHALGRRQPAAQRWALVGALAGLVGVVVDGCFGVGLRVSGVPTVFYTLLGLVWALSATPTTSWVPRLARANRGRVGAGVVAGLVGVAVIVAAQRDFAAARSAFRVDELLAKEDYDGAIQAAQRGVQRLNPQRAVVNLYRLAEANGRAAAVLQRRGVDRQQRAARTQPPDQNLLGLAERDFLASAQHAEEANRRLAQLVSRSPGFLNHGLLEYQVALLQAYNAAMLGAADQEDLFLRQAAAAIERELRRQPFEFEVVAPYIEARGSALPPEEAFRVLARPLRHGQMTQPCLEILFRLLQVPSMAQGFGAVAERARTQVTGETPETEVDGELWAPELLRLSAAVLIRYGRYGEAAEHLSLAARGYERIAGAAPIGATSCYSDLSLCLMLDVPDQPERALEAARRAAALAPESEEGRALRRGARQRMVAYYLAAGDEEQALTLLRGLAPPGASEEDARHEMGLRYSRLCRELLQRRTPDGGRIPPNRLPASFPVWVDRAVELVPENPAAHLVAADLALVRGEDAVAARHLRDALERELPAQDAWSFLLVALRQRPDSAPLLSLQHELWAAFERLPPEQRPVLPPATWSGFGPPLPGWVTPGPPSATPDEPVPAPGVDEAPDQIPPPAGQEDAPSPEEQEEEREPT
jgi:O-antigen ligase